MNKERLYIFDTTLRDGAQTQGVDFSLEDKEKITLALDNLGGDYKEADRIRDELLDKGVLIEDKDGKTLWKFK